jgi:uncharacterized protein (TIGR02246 family)
MTMTSTRIRVLHDTYLDTFATRDVAAIAALHAPDGTFWQRTGLGPVTGRDAIAAAFTALFEQWPDLSCEVREVAFGTDLWVLDWVLDAQGRSGRVRFDCLDVVTVDEAGLVRSKTTFVDLVQAQAALADDARRAG